MNKAELFIKIFLFIFSFMVYSAHANPLAGKMYDYEGIGKSFTNQLNKVLAFESRLKAIKSNKLAFLTNAQIVMVNNALTKISHIKKSHETRGKAQLYMLGRDIINTSLSNVNCSIRNVSLSTKKAIQLNCKGLGYDIEGKNLFAEYEYSDLFLTKKRINGEIVITSYIDGRLTHLEEQLTVIDDEISRVYAPILQENRRFFAPPTL